ncbi:hypothetical protein V8C37DRAFT_379885 [Trichoderma ceciliae]
MLRKTSGVYYVLWALLLIIVGNSWRSMLCRVLVTRSRYLSCAVLFEVFAEHLALPVGHSCVILHKEISQFTSMAGISKTSRVSVL